MRIKAIFFMIAAVSSIALFQNCGQMEAVQRGPASIGSIDSGTPGDSSQKDIAGLANQIETLAKADLSCEVDADCLLVADICDHGPIASLHNSEMPQIQSLASDLIESKKAQGLVMCTMNFKVRPTCNSHVCSQPSL